MMELYDGKFRFKEVRESGSLVDIINEFFDGHVDLSDSKFSNISPQLRQDLKALRLVKGMLGVLGTH
ncbi:MAG: hypothetical protein ACP5MU_06845 [Thermoplasmata archaeon]